MVEKDHLSKIGATNMGICKIILTFQDGHKINLSEMKFSVHLEKWHQMGPPMLFNLKYISNTCSNHQSIHDYYTHPHSNTQPPTTYPTHI
jgi:hypothetical protein